MMKLIEVSKVEGKALDWLVVKCVAKVHNDATLNGRVMPGWWISGLFVDPNNWVRSEEFSPSTNWSHGGPIIDQEDISVFKLEGAHRTDAEGYWVAGRDPQYGAIIANYFDESIDRNSYGESFGEVYQIDKSGVTVGPTRLIAAMRCLVISKFGITAKVPEELL